MQLQFTEMKKNELVQKTISLYSGLGWTSLFAKIRFWDAPYEELEELILKKGKIVDLGCGEGIFANYLALASPDRKVFGVDIDKKRISYANRGLPNTTFVQGDVTREEAPQSDAILLVHLLHHLNSFEEQEALIKKCHSELKKGGKLLLVEVEPKFSLKYLVTWLTDHFLVPWLFERKLYSPIFFRKKEGWLRLLHKFGFSCKITPAEAGKPFTHIILECKKN